MNQDGTLKALTAGVVKVRKAVQLSEEAAGLEGLTGPERKERTASNLVHLVSRGAPAVPLGPLGGLACRTQMLKKRGGEEREQMDHEELSEDHADPPPQTDTRGKKAPAVSLWWLRVSSQTAAARSRCPSP